MLPEAPSIGVLEETERQFLDELYELVKAGEYRRAMAHLFDFVDDRLLEGHYASCARILRAVDLDRLEPTIAIGILSITLQARAPLGADRQELVGRVEPYLLRRREREYVQELLSGLR
jgi:hypothetical protein